MIQFGYTYPQMPSSSNSKITLGKLLSILFEWPIVELIAEGWKYGRKLWRGFSNEGIYEVGVHEASLDILDRDGKRAIVNTRQNVRYLQDNVIAFQAQGWGDGKIFVNFKCSPGVVADKYSIGRKQIALISLREVKEKGETDEFNLQWEHIDGFKKKVEYWGSEISHRTKKLKLRVNFPKSRPPTKVFILENTRNKTNLIAQEAIRKLPDGRHSIVWEVENPRMYEQYVLKWEW